MFRTIRTLLDKNEIKDIGPSDEYHAIDMYGTGPLTLQEVHKNEDPSVKPIVTPAQPYSWALSIGQKDEQK